MPHPIPEFRIVWNGEEYVASAPTILDAQAGQAVTGHSRFPQMALNALLIKLVDLGVQGLHPRR